MPVAAIDVGSGYVKAIANGLSVDSPRVSFPSVVGEFPESLRGQFGAGEIPVIEYDKKVWLTGHYALDQLKEYQVANTLGHEWAGSIPWTVLLLRALFDLGIRSGDVDLVTGIPQSQYAERHRGVALNLMGEHRAVINGEKMVVNIVRNKAMIMPQAAAGVYYWLSQSKELQSIVEANGLIGGIDVGTYTTGFAVLEGGRPSLRLSGGVDIGMSRVASAVGTRLHHKYGVSLDMNESMRIIENRHKVLLKRSLVDLTDEVHLAVRDVVAGPLKSAIYSQWGNTADRMRIGVYGGGAQDFFPFIKQVFNDAELVESNTMGGGRYLPVLGMLTYYAGANGLMGF